MKAPKGFSRSELLTASDQLLALLEVDAGDVLSIHLGRDKVTVKTAHRSNRGRLIPGITTTTEHRVSHEPVES